MKYDNAKLQDAVLALIGAFEFDYGRAWKRYDFSVFGPTTLWRWVASVAKIDVGVAAC